MKNNKVFAIIKHELERSIKNKWFVILNVIMLLAMVIGLNFNSFKAILKNNNVDLDSTTTIYVQDENNLAIKQIEEKYESNEHVVVEKKDNLEEYQNSQIDKNIILVKVEKNETEYVKCTIYSKEAIDNSYIDNITGIVTSLKDKMIQKNKNLTKEEIQLIKADASVERVMLGENVSDDDSYPIIFATAYIIFFVLLLCLSKIANTVAQEKTTKSIEYILTSITPKEYMISKVLSVCLILVTQFIFTIAYAGVAIMVSFLLSNFTTQYNIEVTNSVNVMNYISGRTICYVGITFIYSCITTFVVCMIQCLFAAKTTSIQESGNSTMVLMMLNLILYTMVIALVSGERAVSGLTFVLSLLPIASMYFIPSMFIIGQVSMIQLVLSFVILIATVPLVVIFTQKPFKNAILDYSPKKDKKIDGIEKITSTREYQERMIVRKESSKKGLIIGLSVILLIILQVGIGFLGNILTPVLTRKITFISETNIGLIISTLGYIISVYVPYLLIKAYLPKEDKEARKELTKEEKKQSLIQCIKYIVISLPILGIIQKIAAFAIEKFGTGANINNAIGLNGYNGLFASILMFVQVAICAAIFEELFIRKGIIDLLKEKGSIFAVVVSSFVFALIHMNVTQFVFAFMMGLVLGTVRVRTNKLYPVMIIHFINNGLAVIEAMFYEHMTFMQVFTYITIAFNAVGFCLLIYMLYKKVMELKDKESIQKLKEDLDYRKIKLNLMENMYVFYDYTLAVAIILSAVTFVVVEKVLSLM